MEVLIRGDQELLDSIADIAAAKEDIESQEVQTIIDGFRANTMISHIALLLPGDRVMLPGEPVRDTGAYCPLKRRRPWDGIFPDAAWTSGTRTA